MAELHDRDEHERKLGDCLKRTLGGRERQLVDQLGDPPNINNVDPSLWLDVQFELERCTEEILLAMFLASAAQHLADNILIQISREQARKRMEQTAQVWARKRARELAELLARNSQRMLVRRQNGWNKRAETRFVLPSTLRPGTRPARINGTSPKRINGTPPTKINGFAAAREVFGRNRIRVIATTETTNAIASGGEIAMNEIGLTHPSDVWINRPELSLTGPCPICRPLHRTIRAIWSGKFPFGPPAHVNCVCEIVYWNSVRRIEAVTPDLGSVFIGTPGGDVIAPVDRGTRPFQLGI